MFRGKVGHDLLAIYLHIILNSGTQSKEIKRRICNVPLLRDHSDRKIRTTSTHMGNKWEKTFGL